MATINISGSLSTTGTPILGSISVVFTSDANHTLDVNEYTNKFLQLTSDVILTGERSLIAPLVQGQEFIIQNHTTGDQAIQVWGGSGGSVTVSNGATVAVVCDGINYLVASGGASGSGLPNLPTDGYWELNVSSGVGSWTTAGGGGGGVDATAVTYEPGTPGNWTSPPTQVAQALDDLAAIVIVPPDASIVTYEPGTPSDWPSPPTQVAQALDDLASEIVGVTTIQTFVFQPSGTAGGNVYTDEGLLATATQALNGAPYSIFFDLTYVGTNYYNLATVGAWELAPNGTWTDGGAGWSIIFTNGTTLLLAPGSSPPSCPPSIVEGNLVINVNQSTAPFYANAFITFRQNAGVYISSGGACLFDDPFFASPCVYFTDTSYAQASPGTSVVTSSFHSEAIVYVTPCAVIGPNVMTGLIGKSKLFVVGVGGPTTDNGIDATINVDPSNYPYLYVTGFYIDGTGVGISAFTASQCNGGIVLTGGTFYQSNGSSWMALGGGGSPDATAVTYEPGTPSDWPSPPTQVADALDDLASIVGELATPSILVYDPSGLETGSYTTFTALVNAATAANLKYAIVYMTGDPEVGSYELPASWELVINGTITISDGTVIEPTPFRIRGTNSPTIISNSSGYVLFSSTSGDIVLDGITITGSSYLGIIAPEGLHGGSCTVTMINGASAGDGTNPVFSAPDSEFTFTINAYQQSNIAANSLDVAQFTVNYESGTTISTTQPGVDTIVYNQLSVSNPTSIVFFTPGGTESQNTYTSWADLAAAVINLNYVEVHTSVGGEIPAASYTMPVVWSIVFDQYAQITIDDGVTFSTTPSSITAPQGGAILSNCVSGSPFPNGSGNITLNNIAFGFTGSGSASPVFTFSGYPDIFWINSIGDGVLPVISMSNGQLLCSGSEGQLPANTIALTGEWDLYSDPNFGSSSSNPIDSSYYPNLIIGGIYVDKTGLGITTIPPSNGNSQDLLMDNTTGILYYTTGSAWTAIIGGGGGGSFTAGGDLSGSDTSQTVIGIQTVSISATAPSTGQVLTATGSSAAEWTSPASAPAISSGEITVGTGTGIAGYAGSSLSNASTDYIQMGDISANVATTGFIRTPNMPGSGWETVVAYGTGNVPLLKYGYGGYVEVGDPTTTTLRLAASTGGAFFDLFSEDVQFGLGGTGINYAIFSTYSPGWVIQNINSNVDFEFSNTVSGYRFVPNSGSKTSFSGQIGGDTATNSPLQMGVSAGISITGSYPLTITPTATQYANHVLAFTGTATAAGALTIALPAIVGGASGYSIVCDFTGATLTGLASITFSIGASTYAVAAPTTLAAYLVIWDGTTLRAVILPKA